MPDASGGGGGGGCAQRVRRRQQLVHLRARSGCVATLFAVSLLLSLSLLLSSAAVSAAALEWMFVERYANATCGVSGSLGVPVSVNVAPGDGGCYYLPALRLYAMGLCSISTANAYNDSACTQPVFAAPLSLNGVCQNAFRGLCGSTPSGVALNSSVAELAAFNGSAPSSGENACSAGSANASAVSYMMPAFVELLVPEPGVAFVEAALVCDPSGVFNEAVVAGVLASFGGSVQTYSVFEYAPLTRTWNVGVCLSNATVTGAGSGNWSVLVTCNGAGTASAPGAVYAAMPSPVLNAGGSLLTIVGANLVLPGDSLVNVTVGGANASIVSVSRTMIVVRAPSLAAATGVSSATGGAAQVVVTCASGAVSVSSVSALASAAYYAPHLYDTISVAASASSSSSLSAFVSPSVWLQWSEPQDGACRPNYPANYYPAGNVFPGNYYRVQCVSDAAALLPGAPSMANVTFFEDAACTMSSMSLSLSSTASVYGLSVRCNLAAPEQLSTWAAAENYYTASACNASSLDTTGYFAQPYVWTNDSVSSFQTGALCSANSSTFMIARATGSTSTGVSVSVEESVATGACRPFDAGASLLTSCGARSNESFVFAVTPAALPATGGVLVTLVGVGLVPPQDTVLAVAVGMASVPPSSVVLANATHVVFRAPQVTAANVSTTGGAVYVMVMTVGGSMAMSVPTLPLSYVSYAPYTLNSTSAYLVLRGSGTTFGPQFCSAPIGAVYQFNADGLCAATSLGFSIAGTCAGAALTLTVYNDSACSMVRASYTLNDTTCVDGVSGTCGVPPSGFNLNATVGTITDYPLGSQCASNALPLGTAYLLPVLQSTSDGGQSAFACTANGTVATLAAVPSATEPGAFNVTTLGSMATGVCLSGESTSFIAECNTGSAASSFVFAVQPTSGSVAGGQLVTVWGSRLSAANVTFVGAGAASVVSVPSVDVVVVRAPAGASVGQRVNVSVTTSGGATVAALAGAQYATYAYTAVPLGYVVQYGTADCATTGDAGHGPQYVLELPVDGVCRPELANSTLYSTSVCAGGQLTVTTYNDSQCTNVKRVEVYSATCAGGKVGTCGAPPPGVNVSVGAIVGSSTTYNSAVCDAARFVGSQVYVRDVFTTQLLVSMGFVQQIMTTCNGTGQLVRATAAGLVAPDGSVQSVGYVQLSSVPVGVCQAAASGVEGTLSVCGGVNSASLRTVFAVYPGLVPAQGGVRVTVVGRALVPSGARVTGVRVGGVLVQGSGVVSASAEAIVLYAPSAAVSGAASAAFGNVTVTVYTSDGTNVSSRADLPLSYARYNVTQGGASGTAYVVQYPAGGSSGTGGPCSGTPVSVYTFAADGACRASSTGLFVSATCSGASLQLMQYSGAACATVQSVTVLTGAECVSGLAGMCGAVPGGVSVQSAVAVASEYAAGTNCTGAPMATLYHMQALRTVSTVPPSQTAFVCDGVNYTSIAAAVQPDGSLSVTSATLATVGACATSDLGGGQLVQQLFVCGNGSTNGFVFAVQPTSGSVAGGQLVTVWGSRLSAANVTFVGAGAASVVSVPSVDVVVVRAPAGASVGQRVNVSVTTSGGATVAALAGAQYATYAYTAVPLGYVVQYGTADCATTGDAGHGPQYVLELPVDGVCRPELANSTLYSTSVCAGGQLTVTTYNDSQCTNVKRVEVYSATCAGGKVGTCGAPPPGVNVSVGAIVGSSTTYNSAVCDAARFVGSQVYVRDVFTTQLLVSMGFVQQIMTTCNGTGQLVRATAAGLVAPDGSVQSVGYVQLSSVPVGVCQAAASGVEGTLSVCGGVNSASLRTVFAVYPGLVPAQGGVRVTVVGRALVPSGARVTGVRVGGVLVQGSGVVSASAEAIVLYAPSAAVSGAASAAFGNVTVTVYTSDGTNVSSRADLPLSYARYNVTQGGASGTAYVVQYPAGGSSGTGGPCSGTPVSVYTFAADGACRASSTGLFVSATCSGASLQLMQYSGAACATVQSVTVLTGAECVSGLAGMCGAVPGGVSVQSAVAVASEYAAGTNCTGAPMATLYHMQALRTVSTVPPSQTAFVCDGVNYTSIAAAVQPDGSLSVTSATLATVGACATSDLGGGQLVQQLFVCGNGSTNGFVFAVQPTSGSVAGGQLVTVWGSRLSAANVTFVGAGAASVVSVPSVDVVVVRAPAGASVGQRVNVSVTTSGGATVAALAGAQYATYAYTAVPLGYVVQYGTADCATTGDAGHGPQYVLELPVDGVCRPELANSTLYSTSVCAGGQLTVTTYNDSQCTNVKRVEVYSATCAGGKVGTCGAPPPGVNVSVGAIVGSSTTYNSAVCDAARFVGSQVYVRDVFTTQLLVSMGFVQQIMTTCNGTGQLVRATAAGLVAPDGSVQSVGYVQLSSVPVGVCQAAASGVEGTLSVCGGVNSASLRTVFAVYPGLVPAQGGVRVTVVGRALVPSGARVTGVRVGGVLVQGSGVVSASAEAIVLYAPSAAVSGAASAAFGNVTVTVYTSDGTNVSSRADLPLSYARYNVTQGGASGTAYVVQYPAGGSSGTGGPCSGTPVSVYTFAADGACRASSTGLFVSATCSGASLQLMQYSGAACATVQSVTVLTGAECVSGLAGMCGAVPGGVSVQSAVAVASEYAAGTNCTGAPMATLYHMQALRTVSTVPPSQTAFVCDGVNYTSIAAAVQPDGSLSVTRATLARVGACTKSDLGGGQLVQQLFVCGNGSTNGFVFAVQPTSGSVAGGQLVTVWGSRLSAANVTFVGAGAASVVSVPSVDVVVVRAPAGASVGQRVNVSVTTSGGATVAALAGAQYATYAYTLAPVGYYVEYSTPTCDSNGADNDGVSLIFEVPLDGLCHSVLRPVQQNYTTTCVNGYVNFTAYADGACTKPYFNAVLNSTCTMGMRGRCGAPPSGVNVSPSSIVAVEEHYADTSCNAARYVGSEFFPRDEVAVGTVASGSVQQFLVRCNASATGHVRQFTALGAWNVSAGVLSSASYRVLLDMPVNACIATGPTNTIINNCGALASVAYPRVVFAVEPGPIPLAGGVPITVHGRGLVPQGARVTGVRVGAVTVSGAAVLFASEEMVVLQSPSAALAGALANAYRNATVTVYTSDGTNVSSVPRLPLSYAYFANTPGDSQTAYLVQYTSSGSSGSTCRQPAIALYEFAADALCHPLSGGLFVSATCSGTTMQLHQFSDATCSRLVNSLSLNGSACVNSLGGMCGSVPPGIDPQSAIAVADEYPLQSGCVGVTTSRIYHLQSLRTSGNSQTVFVCDGRNYSSIAAVPQFDGSVSVTSATLAQIGACVPAPTGLVQQLFVCGNGSAAGTAGSAARYLFAVQPTRGNVNGGTQVTLWGSDLVPAGQTIGSVMFGTSAASSVTVVNDDVVVAVAPSSMTLGALVNVSLTTTGSGSIAAPIVALPGALFAQYTFVAAPLGYVAMYTSASCSANASVPNSGVALAFELLVDGLCHATSYPAMPSYVATCAGTSLNYTTFTDAACSAGAQAHALSPTCVQGMRGSCAAPPSGVSLAPAALVAREYEYSDAQCAAARYTGSELFTSSLFTVATPLSVSQFLVTCSAGSLTQTQATGVYNPLSGALLSVAFSTMLARPVNACTPASASGASSAGVAVCGGVASNSRVLFAVEPANVAAAGGVLITVHGRGMLTSASGAAVLVASVRVGDVLLANTSIVSSTSSAIVVVAPSSWVAGVGGAGGRAVVTLVTSDGQALSSTADLPLSYVAYGAAMGSGQYSMAYAVSYVSASACPAQPSTMYAFSADGRCRATSSGAFVSGSCNGSVLLLASYADAACTSMSSLVQLAPGSTSACATSVSAPVSGQCASVPANVNVQSAVAIASEYLVNSGAASCGGASSPNGTMYYLQALRTQNVQGQLGQSALVCDGANLTTIAAVSQPTGLSVTYTALGRVGACSATSSALVQQYIVCGNGSTGVPQGARGFVFAVQPTLGDVDGGTPVTIWGSNLLPLGETSATSVLFAGARATSVSVLSDDVIVAVTPPGASLNALVNISVFSTTGAVASSLPEALFSRYLYLAAPLGYLVTYETSTCSGSASGVPNDGVTSVLEVLTDSECHATAYLPLPSYVASCNNAGALSVAMYSDGACTTLAKVVNATAGATCANGVRGSCGAPPSGVNVTAADIVGRQYSYAAPQCDLARYAGSALFPRPLSTVSTPLGPGVSLLTQQMATCSSAQLSVVVATGMIAGSVVSNVQVVTEVSQAVSACASVGAAGAMSASASCGAVPSSAPLVFAVQPAGVSALGGVPLTIVGRSLFASGGSATLTGVRVGSVLLPASVLTSVSSSAIVLLAPSASVAGASSTGGAVAVSVLSSDGTNATSQWSLQLSYATYGATPPGPAPTAYVVQYPSSGSSGANRCAQPPLSAYEFAADGRCRALASGLYVSGVCSSATLTLTQYTSAACTTVSSVVALNGTNCAGTLSGMCGAPPAGVNLQQAVAVSTEYALGSGCSASAATGQTYYLQALRSVNTFGQVTQTAFECDGVNYTSVSATPQPGGAALSVSVATLAPVGACVTSATGLVQEVYVCGNGSSGGQLGVSGYVFAVQPTTGSVNGGGVVTLWGSNIVPRGQSAASVSFGGVASPSVTTVNDDVIVAVVPQGSVLSSAVNITVTSSGGSGSAPTTTASLAAGLYSRFTYVPAPVAFMATYTTPSCTANASVVNSGVFAVLQVVSDGLCHTSASGVAAAYRATCVDGVLNYTAFVDAACAHKASAVLVGPTCVLGQRAACGAPPSGVSVTTSQTAAQLAWYDSAACSPARYAGSEYFVSEASALAMTVPSIGTSITETLVTCNSSGLFSVLAASGVLVPSVGPSNVQVANTLQQAAGACVASMSGAGSTTTQATCGSLATGAPVIVAVTPVPVPSSGGVTLTLTGRAFTRPGVVVTGVRVGGVLLSGASVVSVTASQIVVVAPSAQVAGLPTGNGTVAVTVLTSDGASLASRADLPLSFASYSPGVVASPTAYVVQYPSSGSSGANRCAQPPLSAYEFAADGRCRALASGLYVSGVCSSATLTLTQYTSAACTTVSSVVALNGTNCAGTLSGMCGAPPAGVNLQQAVAVSTEYALGSGCSASAATGQTYYLQALRSVNTFGQVTQTAFECDGVNYTSVSATPQPGGAALSVSVATLAPVGACVTSATGLVQEVYVCGNGSSGGQLGVSGYVFAVQPTTGSVNGGGVVTLWGSNIVPRGQSAASVSFGGVVSPSVTTVNDDVIVAVVPAQASGGAVNISVRSSGGSGAADIVTTTASLAAGLYSRFTYLCDVRNFSASVAGGPTSGNTRFNLTFVCPQAFSAGAVWVTLNGVNVTSVVVASPTVLTVVSGPTPATGSGPICVSTSAWRVCAGVFTYVAGTGVPITSVLPSMGPYAGGNLVTIASVGAMAASAQDVVQVTVAGVPAVVVSFAPTSIVVRAGPASPTGAFAVGVPGPVQVTSLTVGVSVRASAYQYNPLVVVSSVSPSVSTTVGGARITITGAGFTMQSAQVTLAGVNAGSWTPVSSTMVVVVTPAVPNVVPPGAVVVDGGASYGNASLPNAFSFVFPNPPTVTLAAFRGDLLGVQVQLSADTNVSAQTVVPCASVFTAASVAVLGGGASCQFVTPSVLMVMFGSQAPAATLAPGQLLTWLPFAIRSAVAPVFVGGSFVVAGPTPAVVPVVQLSGTASVGACGTVSLSAVVNGLGGRPAMAVQWAVSSPSGGRTANVSGVLLAASLARQVAVSFDAQVLDAAVPYVFSLTVTNFLGNASVPATFSVVRALSATPTVTILGGNSISSTPLLGLQIGASVTTPPCATYAASYTYSWTLVSGVPASSAGALLGASTSTLTVPPKYLQAYAVSPPSPSSPAYSGQYVFQVMVTPRGAPSLAAGANVTVSVVPSAPVAAIAGGAAVTVASSLTGAWNFTVDASLSSNPNDLLPLVFLWSCSGNLACPSSVQNSTASKLTITLGAGATGALVFTVRVTDPVTQMWATATQTVSVTTAPVLALSISGPTTVVPGRDATFTAVSAQSLPPVLSWTSPDSSVLLPSNLLSPATQPVLVVRGSAFVGGASFTLVLVGNSSSFAGGLSAVATLSVRVLLPPSGGSCSVTPMTGSALATWFVASTAGWSTVSPPLTYRFEAMSVATRTSTLLSDASQSPSSNFTLATGAWNVSVVVIDVMGGTTVWPCGSGAVNVSAPAASNADQALNAAQAMIALLTSEGDLGAASTLLVATAGVLDQSTQSLTTAQDVQLRGELLGDLASLQSAGAVSSGAAFAQLSSSLAQLASASVTVLQQVVSAVVSTMSSLVSAATSQPSAIAVTRPTLLSLVNTASSIVSSLPQIMQRSEATSTTGAVESAMRVSMVQSVCGQDAVDVSSQALPSASEYNVQASSRKMAFTDAASGLTVMGHSSTDSVSMTLSSVAVDWLQNELPGDSCFGYVYQSYKINPYRSVSDTMVFSDVGSLTLYSVAGAQPDAQQMRGSVTLSLPLASTIPLGSAASCAWWNAATSAWNATGCSTVPDQVSSPVTCTCSRIGTFGVIGTAIPPEPPINYNFGWIAAAIIIPLFVVVLVVAVVVRCVLRRRRAARERAETTETLRESLIAETLREADTDQEPPRTRFGQAAHEPARTASPRYSLPVSRNSVSARDYQNVL